MHHVNYEPSHLTCLRIASWNIQSWTQCNGQLRESIIKSTGAHIICLSETHLKDNDVISVSGFSRYGNNRSDLHRRAKSGSGGCGILINNSVLCDFKVEVVLKNMDGILGLKLIDKISGISMIIYSCYLPPES